MGNRKKSVLIEQTPFQKGIGVQYRKVWCTGKQTGIQKLSPLTKMAEYRMYPFDASQRENYVLKVSASIWEGLPGIWRKRGIKPFISGEQKSKTGWNMGTRAIWGNSEIRKSRFWFWGTRENADFFFAEEQGNRYCFRPPPPPRSPRSPPPPHAPPLPPLEGLIWKGRPLQHDKLLPRYSNISGLWKYHVRLVQLDLFRWGQGSNFNLLVLRQGLHSSS